MSAIIKQCNGVTYHSTSAVGSPGGVEPLLTGRNWCSEPLFGSKDRCASCGYFILGDVHRLFIFYHSPADIEHAEIMGGVPSEWRPDPDSPPIPGDQGPNRVAYRLHGEPLVQVHDGDDSGFWTPCSSYTVTRDGMPYTMWICRRDHLNDPCDEDFLRSIST